MTSGVTCQVRLARLRVPTEVLRRCLASRLFRLLCTPVATELTQGFVGVLLPLGPPKGPNISQPKLPTLDPSSKPRMSYQRVPPVTVRTLGTMSKSIEVKAAVCS